MLERYEQTLLTGWEDVYKKGQLTLWILLALKDGPKHMATIKNYILESTNNLLVADDKSMYRALRRYFDADMVEYRLENNNHGPDRKLYYLSHIGAHVLDAFIERNIVGVFSKPQVKKILNT